MQSIEKSTDHIVDFARLTEAIAAVDSQDAATNLYKSFSLILDRYNYTPPNFSGSYQVTQHEFFKFIGHELFTIFISFLIRENSWKTLTNILEEGIFVTKTYSGNLDSITFEYISQHVSLFNYRKQRLTSNRMSIHADLLKERHSTGQLGEICPMDQLVSADFFLYLRSNRWIPWSALYLLDYSNFPKFIIEAKREKYAKQLFEPLGVEDIESLRKVISAGNAQLRQYFSSGFWHSSIDDFDF